jgi:hypothetical protein
LPAKKFSKPLLPPFSGGFFLSFLRQIGSLKREKLDEKTQYIEK